MYTHKIGLSACAAVLMVALPNVAEAQSLGDLFGKVKRNVEEIENILENDAFSRAVSGEQSFPGDILIPARSPLATDAEHIMLVKVEEPVREAGTYRFILRDAGSRGQRGVRHTSFLSDRDLDTPGYVVVRFKAPGVAGDYELQVTRENVNEVLGSTTIRLGPDAQPAISVPATAGRAQRVPVEIAGDRYYYNRLGFVRDGKTVKAMQFDQIVTEDGENIVTPSRPGRYDLVITYGYQHSQPRSVRVGTIEVR